nr:MAG TPA: hypothetical protein [Caudoviricetes sp.]
MRPFYSWQGAYNKPLQRQGTMAPGLSGRFIPGKGAWI